MNKDKNIIASAGYDGKIKLWNVENMKCVKELNSNKLENITQRLSNIVIYSLTFSSDDLFIAISNNLGIISIWEIKTGKISTEICPT